MVETLLPVVGFGLCTLALLQLGLWAAQTYLELSHNEKQFELSQSLLRAQVKQAQEKEQRPNPSASEDRLTEESSSNNLANLNQISQPQPIADLVQPDGSWKGFRSFRVMQIVPESAGCKSIFLQPEDGHSIVGFQPGQHLTFKIHLPGKNRSLVRCYSLSDSADKNYYRISVRSVAAPANQPDVEPGVVSNFLVNELMVGDVVQAKAPSGNFYLDQSTNAPVVLLAGGIGITPLLSMMEHLTAAGSQRLAVLVYGSRNSQSHAFKNRLQELAQLNPNLHVINTYSAPLPTDIEGTDYHCPGHVSVNLLQRLLPNNKYQFYLCGPPAFMDSIYQGLLAWDVPSERIKMEAFGPSSIVKAHTNTTVGAGGNTLDITPVPNLQTDIGSTVTFAKSDQEASWNSIHASILELAEEAGVMIDSGCRAGSCGTCETDIISGSVVYPSGVNPECPPSRCLACIARPNGPVELDV